MSGLYSEVIKKLPAFIDELRLNGFRIGVSEQLSVQRLLLGLRVSGQLPENLVGLETVIGPVLCTSQEEQLTLFPELYRNWIQRCRESDRDSTPKGEKRKDPGRDIERAPVLWKHHLLLLLLGLTIIWSVHHIWAYYQTSTYIKRPRPSPTADVNEPLKSPTSTPSPMLTNHADSDVAWDASRRWRPDWIGVGGLFLSISALLYLLVNRRNSDNIQRFLERKSSWGEEKLFQIRFVSPSHYNSGKLLDTARVFRKYKSVETERIDPEKTLKKTLESGLFTPVYKRRATLPEYLALVSCRGLNDHQAQSVFALLDELKAQGIFIDIYCYSRDPRLAWRRGDRKDWVSLEELQGRHPQHQLWIFSDDGVELFAPKGIRKRDWSESLTYWGPPMVLTQASSSELTGHESALNALGFKVTALEESDFRAALVSKGEKRAAGVFPEPIPVVFDMHDWLSETSPPVNILWDALDELKLHLGVQGYRLLVGIALYPEMKWELTQELIRQLFRKDWEHEHHVLLRLFRLPWLRAGRMPDWLRIELIGSLDKAELILVRSVFDNLLCQSLGSTLGKSCLEIANPSSLMLWRELLRQLNLKVAKDALDDKVFLSEISRNRLFLVPEELGRYLRAYFHRLTKYQNVGAPRKQFPSLVMAAVFAGGFWVFANIFGAHWFLRFGVFYLWLAGCSRLVNPNRTKKHMYLWECTIFVLVICTLNYQSPAPARWDYGIGRFFGDPLLWNNYPNPIFACIGGGCFRAVEYLKEKGLSLWWSFRPIALQADRLLKNLEIRLFRKAQMGSSGLLPLSDTIWSTAILVFISPRVCDFLFQDPGHVLVLFLPTIWGSCLCDRLLQVRPKFWAFKLLFTIFLSPSLYFLLNNEILPKNSLGIWVPLMFVLGIPWVFFRKSVIGRALRNLESYLSSSEHPTNKLENKDEPSLLGFCLSNCILMYVITSLFDQTGLIVFLFALIYGLRTLLNQQRTVAFISSTLGLAIGSGLGLELSDSALSDDIWTGWLVILGGLLLFQSLQLKRPATHLDYLIWSGRPIYRSSRFWDTSWSLQVVCLFLAGLSDFFPVLFLTWLLEPAKASKFIFLRLFLSSLAFYLGVIQEYGILGNDVNIVILLGSFFAIVGSVLGSFFDVVYLWWLSIRDRTIEIATETFEDVASVTAVLMTRRKK